MFRNNNNNNNKNNNKKLFIYLHAELNSRWPITESALTQTTVIGQMQGQNKQKQEGLGRSNRLLFL
jgi:hypothetical protein